MEYRTIDSILETFDKWVKEKQIIGAHQWLEAAQYLNVLISEEHDKLYQLEQGVAKQRLTFLEESENVSRAKIKVEALDIYREMKNQKAKIGRIEEFIRIAKLQARLKDSEYRNQ